jgi:hypothetical protein
MIHDPNRPLGRLYYLGCKNSHFMNDGGLSVPQETHASVE